MALQPAPQNKTASKGIDKFTKDEGFSVTPFKVIVSKFNAETNGTVEAKVTRYSSLMPSLNMVDTYPIIGLDWNFEIKYGTKVFLEVFYDKNLNPICPNVQYGKKWSSTTLNPADNKARTTYPSLIETITKKDVDAKLAELRTRLSSNDSIKSDVLDEIQSKVDSGLISKSFGTAYSNKITTDYKKIQDDLQVLINDFSKYFTGTALTRKQFKSYTLLAYTTKDLSNELEGRIVSPVLGTTESQGVPQSQKDPSYRLVQCLTNDLLLVDVIHNNAIPGKLPFPYSRPIYYFDVSGKSEEEFNTK